MQSVWKNIRSSIALQPIPKGFFSIQEGDVADSPYGDFVALSKREVYDKASNDSNTRDKILWEGYFLNWQLCNGTRVRASLQESVLDKKRDMKIWCFDCESKSVTQFHFLGLECKNCGGFNTTKE